MSEHKISPRQCFERIRGVCCRCGGPLTPLETVDNSGTPTFWAGCPDCRHFDCGVRPIVHRVAQKLVKEGEVYYSHMDRPHHKPAGAGEREYAAYYLREQTAGWCSIVPRILHLYRELTEERRPGVGGS